MLVSRELVEEVLLGELSMVTLLGAKVLGDRELRHDRSRINGVGLYLIHNLLRIADGFWQVGEDGSHLLGCLEPLLLGVMHAVHIVHIVVGTEADKSVMRFGVLLLHKVHIVGGYDFDIMLACQVNEHLVHHFLYLVGMLVGSRLLGLVALQFYIVVLAEECLEPFDGLLGLGEILCAESLHDFLWQLATQAGGAADESLVVLLQ